MESYPKITSVKSIKNRRLLVTFDNGVKKYYDCNPLLKEEVFSSLNDEVLFKCVKVDESGYGISWNDEIDLSESELWLNGMTCRDV